MPTFADITTFKVGGPIARLMRCATRDEFVTTLAQLAAAGDPYLIVGGGSNIVGPDAYAGTVVTPTFKEISYTDDHVVVDAGANWDALVAETVARGWWGLENLSGIPGTVGGAVVQNIGAYGAVLSDHLKEVEVYDIANGEIKVLSRAECAYGYRTSIFKQMGQYAVLRVTLNLSTTPRPNLVYKDLAAAFPSGTASLSEIRTAVITIRAGKFPDLSTWGTAGSFFLNPIVSAEEAAQAQAHFPGMPVFIMPEGGVKIPIAWILDHVVKVKGMREGGAVVWPEHALVIATEKSATAHDVRTLAEKISLRVEKETGIKIFPEVMLL